MSEAILETKKWGNSIGVILPKEVLEKENIHENEKIFVLVRKQRNVVAETFGMAKGKLTIPTQKLKDQMRKELYGI